MGYLALFSVVSSFYILGLIWTAFLPDIRLPKPPDGQKPKAVIISYQALAPSILMFLTGLAVSAVVVYMALYCNEIGLPYSGHFFGFSTIGIILSRLFAGNLYDRFGHRVVLAPSIFLILVAVLIITQFHSLATVLTASIIWGLSTGTLFPCIQALAFTSVRPDLRTAAASSLFNSLDLGFGAGSVVFGLTAEKAGTYGAVYWAAAINALIFLGFYVFYFIILKPGKAPANSEKIVPCPKNEP
jgi:MFS family permease